MAIAFPKGTGSFPHRQQTLNDQRCIVAGGKSWFQRPSIRDQILSRVFSQGESQYVRFLPHSNSFVTSTMAWNDTNVIYQLSAKDCSIIGIRKSVKWRQKSAECLRWSANNFFRCGLSAFGKRKAEVTTWNFIDHSTRRATLKTGLSTFS